MSDLEALRLRLRRAPVRRKNADSFSPEGVAAKKDVDELTASLAILARAKLAAFPPRDKEAPVGRRRATGAR